MDRRRFIYATGALLLAPARNPRAEHHVVSANSLVIESDLSPLADRYTHPEDLYVRNHFQTPEPIAIGLLTIEGEVDKSASFTLANFQSIPVHEFGAVLECQGIPGGRRAW